jgi:hypothetical protein
MYASNSAEMGAAIPYGDLLNGIFSGSAGNESKWVEHLMENPMDKIKIFWPPKGLYRDWGYNGDEQISADLYIHITINGCHDVLRVASTNFLGEG